MFHRGIRCSEEAIKAWECLPGSTHKLNKHSTLSDAFYQVMGPGSDQ